MSVTLISSFFLVMNEETCEWIWGPDSQMEQRQSKVTLKNCHVFSCFQLRTCNSSYLLKMNTPGGQKVQQGVLIVD